MTAVTFVAFDGASRTVEAEPGQTLMQAAVAHQVPGVIGECGGSLACGSCHVYVDENWAEMVGRPSDLEGGMLEVGVDVRPNSRLACQIRVSEDLDGLVVLTPERQNF